MSAANRRSTASPGAKAPWLSNSAAVSTLPTGKKMKIASKRGDHDDDRRDGRVALERAAARDGAREARGERERARRARRGRTTAPVVPAAKPAANAQATAPPDSQRGRAIAPRHARTATAHDRGDQRPARRDVAAERVHQRGRSRPSSAHGSADERGERRPPRPTPSRGRAPPARRPATRPWRVVTARRITSAASTTSASHFFSRRLRSADEPYFAKS